MAYPQASLARGHRRVPQHKRILAGRRPPSPATGHDAVAGLAACGQITPTFAGESVGADRVQGLQALPGSVGVAESYRGSHTDTYRHRQKVGTYFAVTRGRR